MWLWNNNNALIIKKKKKVSRKIILYYQWIMLPCINWYDLYIQQNTLPLFTAVFHCCLSLLSFAVVVSQNNLSENDYQKQFCGPVSVPSTKLYCQYSNSGKLVDIVTTVVLRRLSFYWEVVTLEAQKYQSY